MAKGFYFTFESALLLLAVIIILFSWPKIVSSNAVVQELSLTTCDDWLIVAQTQNDPTLAIQTLSEKFNPSPLVSFSRNGRVVLSADTNASSTLACETNYWNGERIELWRLVLRVVD